nr:hypothetical protein [Clostridia bacterium]
MKKLLAAILIAAMALPMFAACSSDNGNTADTTTAGETTAAVQGDTEPTAAETEAKFPHEAKDFGGKRFKIIVDYDGNTANPVDYTDLAVESENGDVLNDAVYERNAFIEDTFNVKLESYNPPKTFSSDLTATIAAGADDYDA